MMRVVIYGRINNIGLTADAQLESLRSFCKEREYEVVGEVRDCCRGSAIGNNLKKLLNERRRGYDAIVLRDISRISRSLVKLLEIIKALNERGIQLIAVDVPGGDIPKENAP